MVSEDLKLFIESFASAVNKKYDIIFNTLDHAVQLGKSNAGEGMVGMDAMFEFLHGGPYRYDVNIQQVPSYLAIGGKDESKSPYYVGFTRATYLGGDWWDVLTSPGVNEISTLGKTDAANVIVDARVPRLLPKILGDEMYARWMVARSQLITTQIFSSVTTSISSLVEATGEAVGRIERGTAALVTARRGNDSVQDLAALKETEKKT